MARVSPLYSAFNGGEWSPLMDGRVTHERYGTALRQSSNFVGLVQGPAIRRSGSKFVAPQFAHSDPGRMIDFEFSVIDAFMLGFEQNRIRFMRPNGLLLESSNAVSALVSLSPFTLTIPGHGYSVGDEVFFDGFPVECRLFQGFGIISSIDGDDVTFDAVNAAGYAFAGGQTVARVFHVTTPYNSTKLLSLRHVQSADTLYLFEPTTRTQVLTRHSTHDWPIRDFEFKDGPYLPVNDTPTVLTPASTGNAIVAFNPANADSDSATGLFTAERAFDDDATTGWESGNSQSGWVQYDFGTQTPLRGYTIVGRHHYNGDIEGQEGRAAHDFNPASWFVDGSNDLMGFSRLDTRVGFALYSDSDRTPFFEFNSDPSFRYYRLTITECVGAGEIGPHVSELRFTPAQSEGSSSITFNASSTTGINRDAGFLSTDVGRPLRFRATDAFWRWYTITAVNSPTQVVCRQESGALPDLAPTTEWRLGAFSDTTGWPTCGFFFEDRLIVGGGTQNPDFVAGSKVGAYENFAPSDPDGTVTGASSWVSVLNGRKVGAVTWITGDDKGLLVGTINGPWVIRSQDSTRPLTAATAKARPVARRPCANVEPVAVDDEVLFLPRSQRVLRALTYNFNADGYRAPNVSLFSSHLGASQLQRIVYAGDPHSIMWGYRADGSLVGLTYNRDEGVFGWHPHTIGGDGEVTDVGVLYSLDGTSEELWLQVRRTIEGQTRYYYEVLQPFWDFLDTLDTAWFADCGFEYQGDPATIIEGLWPLEGQTVSILADGVPIAPQIVIGGRVTLTEPASRVMVGPGYDSYGEIMRPEAGAADGTSQGDTVRAHKAKVRLWNSLGGEIGPVGGLQELDYRTPEQEVGSRLELFSGDYGPVDFPDGYNDGVIAFRQPAANPLPFNVVAIMPKQLVQEGG